MCLNTVSWISNVSNDEVNTTTQYNSVAFYLEYLVEILSTQSDSFFLTSILKNTSTHMKIHI